MFNKKTFTVSIGEYGSIVALHNGKDVQNKILIATLNNENKPQLETLFAKNKSAPIYILIDTIDQNYKKKTYPPVNRSDFDKIVKRDIRKEFENDSKSFQNYYGFKDKIQKKWECIFASIPYSEEMEKWLEFLLSLPNHLAGIHMLPIETNGLATAVLDLIKTEKQIKINENTILSFIIQNKISGVRQVAFSGRSIIFTRVVNYDFEEPQFAAHFEQDIFRANEYLKMMFPKLKAQDVTIINLLSEDVIEKISGISNRESNFINYSPYQIAEKLGITNAVPKVNGNFSDIIVANYFANNKDKILKFTNPKASFLDKIYLALSATFILSGIIMIGLVVGLFKTAFDRHQYNAKIATLQSNKAQLEQQFQSINQAALGDGIQKDDDALANEIIDFGKIDDLFSETSINIPNIFNRLTLLKKDSAAAYSFSYKVFDHNPKGEAFNISNSKFVIEGEISDSSGDIEVLFKKFDALNLHTKNSFPEYNIKYSEISKNIDFSKKYYSFPFDLTIENKQAKNR